MEKQIGEIIVVVKLSKEKARIKVSSVIIER